MTPKATTATGEQVALSAEDLVDRLYRASTEDTLASVGDFSNVPMMLGKVEVGVDEVATEIIYRAGIVTKAELVAAKGILKAKRDQFVEDDNNRGVEEDKLREDDPDWKPKQPSYFHFVGGSLLNNLNVAADTAKEHSGSDIHDVSLLKVTNFLGRIIANNGLVEATIDNVTELHHHLPDTGS